ncbi:MAG: ABC transporter ATP-binding protein/permease [Actinomycetia bacterium]|nr:ABC transporter ATP-binding protein/permease [Actinomycetes bacterium]
MPRTTVTASAGVDAYTGASVPFRKVARKFLRYYTPYKGLLAFDLLCATLVSAVNLAFPLILSALTKGLFSGPSAAIYHALWLIALGMVALAIISCASQYYITYWGHLMGARMETTMRQDLFDQYQRLSFSYYDRNNTGEMMSKLISDLFDITELAHHGPENLLIAVLMIVGSLTILFFINIPMTLILFAITVTILVLSYYKNRQMGAAFFDNRVKMAGINTRLQDTLSGIRIVKSFTNEDMERRKFSRGNLAFLESKSRAYRTMADLSALNVFSQGLLYAAVLVCGGFFIARGTLTAPWLAVYALYITMFMSPIKLLVEFTELFQQGYAGFRRLLEVLSEDPGITEAPGAVALTAASGGLQNRIRYDNVSFGYGSEEDVVCGIDFEIPAGSTVALVGPSGGGKSTLCALLPRFYEVRAGAVTVDGQDVREVTLESLRGAIGIVQQDVYLFAGSIGENIAYGRPDATAGEVEQAAKDANIHDFICSLPDGYDTYVGERGVRLSGGQKQRIAIARVFLKDPPILILDEATSALDNESERYVQRSLERLSHGRTTLVIAHRLSTIRTADHILVISGGAVREQGTHAELLAANGLYAHYYNLQFEGLESHRDAL